MSQDMVVQGWLSYPHLFTPRQVQGSGDPKYSANVIVAPNFDWAPIQAAIAAAFTEKFPGKVMDASVRMPLDQVKEGPYAGYFQLKTSSAQDRRPQVVGANPSLPMGPQELGQIFPGCLVNVWFRLFGYDHMGLGVSAGLNGVQIVSTDASLARLDSSKDASEIFSVVAGAPAPTAQAPGMPAQQPPQQVAPPVQPQQVQQPPQQVAPPVQPPVQQPPVQQPPVQQPPQQVAPVQQPPQQVAPQPQQPGAVAPGAPGAMPWAQ